MARWAAQQVRATDKTSNGDGIAVFDLTQAVNNSVELFASAIVKDRQAFTVGNGYGYNQHEDSWKIYAFCDRPAYRPQETVQWKIIARKYDGSVYSTPSGQTIEFEVHDPRGAKIKEEKLTLNPFGTAWGAIEVTEKMALGEYRVTFYDSGKKISIGNATLFRLEEYKLPEFKVTVQTPEENGQKKTFRVGDKITANIQADYYFGGPVVSGNVEVLVYQNPFYHYWHPVRDYPGFMKMWKRAVAGIARLAGGRHETGGCENGCKWKGLNYVRYASLEMQARISNIELKPESPTRVGGKLSGTERYGSLGNVIMPMYNQFIIFTVHKTKSALTSNCSMPMTIRFESKER